MPKRGGLGLDMMTRTCTVQVNLDFADEADMVAKFRVGLRVAAGRHGPLRQLAVHRRQAQRLSQLPQPDLDRHRPPTAPATCPSSSRTASGSKRYVDWMLDVPMYFVYRDGTYVDTAGESFRDFMAGRLPQLPARCR